MVVKTTDSLARSKFTAHHLQQFISKVLWYVTLTALGFIFSLPFFWMVSSSLKIEADVWLYPPKWIPNPVLWENYPKALTLMNFPRLLANTLFLVTVGTFGVVLSSSWIAYGFARFRFRGRDAVFVILLSTMMLPGQVTMVPLYILYKQLGWLNTYLPLLVPAYFGGAFYIFLLRQFMATIPTELDDAAKIDGCGYIGIWWRIILPLIKPALATVTVFSVIYGWNDFLWPLIILNDSELFNLSLGLATFRGLYSTQWNYLMAASVVVLTPCLILYFVAQRFIVEGITLTGLKG
ncbi:MAG: carbohydrate ABC transporter permease [Anaerolineae bacterium]|nr:carbohydrate ABC transporter permease [Anaerolineae bacterium]MDW8097945.1 carbohydrate ABC transporter permease [Anaerolineae bacterium]